METPTQIVFREATPSAVLQELVREKAEQVGKAFLRFTRCRVSIGRQHRHQTQDTMFGVRTLPHVPNDELVASERRHKEVRRRQPGNRADGPPVAARNGRTVMTGEEPRARVRIHRDRQIEDVAHDPYLARSKPGRAGRLSAMRCRLPQGAATRCPASSSCAAH